VSPTALAARRVVFPSLPGSGRDEIGLAIERNYPKIGGVDDYGDRGTGKSTTMHY